VVGAQEIFFQIKSKVEGAGNEQKGFKKQETNWA
jgi:hypothetical protein